MRPPPSRPIATDLDRNCPKVSSGTGQLTCRRLALNASANSLQISPFVERFNEDRSIDLDSSELARKAGPAAAVL